MDASNTMTKQPALDLPRGRAPARRNRLSADRAFVPIATTPALVVMLLIFGLPLLYSLYTSLTVGGSPANLFSGRFVGIDNYLDLLTDPQFTGAAAITLLYTFVAVVAEMLLGLGIALLLTARLPGMGFFRTAMIVPMMITPIVGAVCWKLLLDPSYGVINQWLGTPTVWLGQPSTAIWALLVVAVWQNTTYVTLILLAGLSSLPREPLEAATIDGASRVQSFWHVTLPMLRPYLMVSLLLRIIFEFRAFDNIYVMTGGGPANATMVLSMYAYLTSFVQFDFSTGSTAAWLMLLIALLLCVFFAIAMRRTGEAK